MARTAITGALLVTCLTAAAGHGTSPPPPARVMPDRAPWDLGDGTWFSPVSGRTFGQAGAGAGATAMGAAGATGTTDDVRLAGQRRSPFYPSVVPVDGPGRTDLLTGGLCDGLAGRDVSVDPSEVVVDRAGRVFWVDHGGRGHLKGLPYVRTLDPDGTVRTLGNLGGPIEGRHLRDFAAAEVAARLAPDGRGGVWFSHSGWLYRPHPSNAQFTGDDNPASVVIGHLDATGRATYVAGAAPSESATDGTLDEATFQTITAMAYDGRGHLFVADGPMPWGSVSASPASDKQRSYDPPAPASSNTTSGGTLLRVVNLTGERATFAGVEVPARSVRRIGGVRENGTAVEPGGAPVPLLDARLGFVPSLAAGADGVVRALQVGTGTAQVLAFNPTAATVRAHGVPLPAARVASVAGSAAGFADGPGSDAMLDVRAHQSWFYGDVAADDDGVAWVADTVNNRLRRVGTDGVVSSAAVPLAFPMGVAVAPDGGVVVSDSYGARIVRVDGARVTTLAGNGRQGWCDGARNDGTFLGGAAALSPHDAVTDSRGNVYVADIALGVVQRIAPDGTTTIAVGTPHDCRSGSPAHQGLPVCPFVEPAGDGGAPEDAVLQAPSYLAVDPYDNLYVSDGSSVRYVNFGAVALRPQDVRVAPGTIGTVFSVEAVITRVERVQVPGFGEFGEPYRELVGLGGVAVDKANTLYVADLNGRRVVRITYCGELTPVAGTGALPAVPGAGDGGPAVAAAIAPVGLALDEQRQVLFVASTAEQRVRAVNVGLRAVDLAGVPLAPGFVMTYAGGGRCVGASLGVGLCSYGDGLAAGQAAMIAPMGVTAAPGGRVYVADALANRIRVVEPDGVMGTLAGVSPDHYGVSSGWHGAGGYCGDGGVAFRACVGGVTGLSLDRDGDLLVAEMMTGIVRRVRDAADAPLRPRALFEPPRGEGWRFSAPVTLVAPADVDARDPDIAIAPDGTGYVLARQATDRQGAAGCALWRYTVSRTARADVAIALPEPDGAGPVPGLDRGVGRSCSLAVTREPAGSLVPPVVGDAVRVAFASTAVVPDDPLVGGVVESAITGASRSGGEDFLRSPAGVVGASLAVRVPRLGVEDGSNTFYLAYCCAGSNADTGAKGIAVARGAGGVQYQQVGTIAFDAARKQSPPYSERQFVGTPIVRGDRVLVPFYADACAVPVAECTSQSPRATEAFVALSEDGGATWTNGEPLFRYGCTGADRAVNVAFCNGSHGVPQLAADRDGNLAFVWDDGHHVFLRTSRDGTTWTPPARVDRDLSAASYATVVGGDAGRFGVAFLGSARPVPGAFALDAEWSVYLAVTTDGGTTFAQSLASPEPVLTGPLCQYMACLLNGQWEAVIGNVFHAAVNPVDGRVVVAAVTTAGRLGATGGSRVVVLRQCSGPPLAGHAKDSPCAPPPAPAKTGPAPLSRATNDAVPGVLTCARPAPQAPPSAAPRPPHRSAEPSPAPAARRPDRAPPAAVMVPGAVAVAVPPPPVQPAQAPQPNAQPQANAEHAANPLTAVAPGEDEEYEVAGEYAMVRRDPVPLVPWALAAAVFAAAGLAHRRRTSYAPVRVRRDPS